LRWTQLRCVSIKRRGDAAFSFVVFGAWASFDRDIFAKLFLGFSFDYWDENRPAILFFAAMLSIMAIYIFAAFYALKAAERKRGNKEKVILPHCSKSPAARSGNPTP
jgi:hypothetical protein